MVHRYRINSRRLMGPDDEILTGATVSYMSGNTMVTATRTFNQLVDLKHITLPVLLNFEPTDYSDLIDKWVFDETQRVIGKIKDGETIKYVNTNNLEIEFRFLDTTTNQYQSTVDYTPVGFTTDEFNTNGFTKSYYRLYFYDSSSGETNNLLFTEDIGTKQDLKINTTPIPKFPLKRLYWYQDDEQMFNNFTDRTVYMEAKFFNAKTGKIHKFINVPTTNTTQISINDYSNPSNREWRYSPIRLINPNNSLGNYRFQPINGVGGNTSNKITMSEFILS